MTDRNALVVDDHPTNRLLAGALLKKLGWTVREAESGEAHSPRRPA
jgi:CheY-like chemotaxis protein